MQNITKTLIVVLLSILCCTVTYAKGKRITDVVVAVLDWSAVVAASPDAKQGDKIVEELWNKEQDRILKLASELQKQLDAKPATEKQSFEEQARKQIADEIQKSSQLVQQETLKYAQITVEKIRRAVEDYCKRNKISIVINKQAGVIYAEDVIDITDDIIKEITK